jgi:hypothetical protein
MAQQRGIERGAGIVSQRGLARGGNRGRSGGRRWVRQRRDGEVLDHVQQVVFAALVGAAIPLDEPAARRDLVAEPPIRASGGPRRRARADQRLLLGEAAAARRSQRSEASTRSEPCPVPNGCLP